MKIEYHLDQNDLRRILIFRFRRSPALAGLYRLTGWIGLGLLAGGLLVLALVSGHSADPALSALWPRIGWGMLTAGLPLTLTSLLIYFLVPAQEARDPKYQGRLGRYELEARKDGLTQSSEGRRLRLEWRRIKKVIARRGFLFIFYDVVNAVAVPLAALGPEGRDEIFRLAAGGGTPEVTTGGRGLKYALEKNDLRRLASGSGREMLPLKFNVRLARVILALSFLGLFHRDLQAGLAGGGFGPWTWAGALLTAVLVWQAPGLVKWFMGLGGRLAAALSDLPAEERELELPADGLVERAGGRELELKWSRLKKLAVRGDLIVITAHGHENIIVPARAFPGQAEREVFLEKLSAAAGLLVTGRNAEIS